MDDKRGSQGFLDVFIVGPMGRMVNADGKDVLDKGNVPQQDHISNIYRAIQLRDASSGLSLAEELSTDFGVLVRPSSPNPDEATEPFTDIARYVFSRIEACDLLIADISARSPSVMYEIAVAHALGKPYLLLDYSPYDKEKEIWYFNGALVRTVPSFAELELRKTLRTVFRSILAPATRGVENFSDNKLTTYYDGVPLVDVSAVAGIAAGYFHNFVQHMAHELGPISLGEYRQLLIVRPSDIENVESFKQRMRKEFGEARLSAAEKIFSQTHPRKQVIADILDGVFLVDYPTPIESLVHSVSYKSLMRRVPEGDSQMRIELEGKLIDAFFFNLMRFIRLEPRTAIRRVRIVSESELLGMSPPEG